MADEINQNEGAVHSPETMDLMDAEVLKKTNVPLYFDNGVDEKVLIGTATIEPDGEITMQVDPLEGPSAFAVQLLHSSVATEPTIEELWAKRRTY